MRRRARQWVARSLLAATLPAMTLQAGEPDRATSSMRMPTRVYQLPRGREDAPAPVITALRLHPDGRTMVVAGDDHLVRLLDVPSGKVVRTLPGHRDWVGTVEFSPNGQILASSGHDQRVILWPLDANAALRPVIIGPLNGAVSQIRFSHDGKRMAVVGFAQPLQLFQTETGAPLGQMECPCRDMRCVAFSPDERWLAGGGRNGRVRIWDVATGRAVATFAAHRQRIRALTFDQNGQRLITAGEDRAVRVFEAGTWIEQDAMTDLPSKVLALAALPGDRLAAAGSDNVIRVWDLSAQRLVSQLRGHTGSVAALDCRGPWLVSGGYDATIRVWPLEAMDEAIAVLERSRNRQLSLISPDASTTQATSVVPNR